MSEEALAALGAVCVGAVCGVLLGCAGYAVTLGLVAARRRLSDHLAGRRAARLRHPSRGRNRPRG